MPVVVLVGGALRAGLRPMAKRAAAMLGKRAAGMAQKRALSKLGEYGAGKSSRAGIAVAGRSLRGLSVGGGELKRTTLKSSVRKGLQAVGSSNQGAAPWLKIANQMSADEMRAQRRRIPVKTGALRRALTEVRSSYRKLKSTAAYSSIEVELGYATYVASFLISNMLPGSDFALALVEWIFTGGG